MARQRGFSNQDSGWRDLAWAAAAAALVTLVLVIGVALAWLVGGGSNVTPTLSSAERVTPTPRAILFARSTPKPPPPAAEPAPAPTVASDDGAAPAAASTAQPEEAKQAFEASSKAAFGKLATAPWTVSGDTLVNDGANAIAQRWLTLSPVASTDVIIEAEIRVTNVLSSVCDQSFGIAGGSPAAGLVFGAGVIFPCSGGEAEARLSNVTTWESGYNVAPEIAAQAFDPGDGWHTYRFELRGKKLRLAVDGVVIVSGEADPSLDPAARDVEAGLWSQGVGIEVKSVTVSPLPR